MTAEKQLDDARSERAEIAAQVAEIEAKVGSSLTKKIAKLVSGEEPTFTEEELDKPIRLKTADREYRTIRELRTRLDELNALEERLSKKILEENSKPKTPDKAAEKVTSQATEDDAASIAAEILGSAVPEGQ